jgi:hypothetical protein
MCLQNSLELEPYAFLTLVGKLIFRSLAINRFHGLHTVVQIMRALPKKHDVQDRSLEVLLEPGL